MIVQLPSYYGCQKGFYKDSAISGVITIPTCLKACDNASYVWIKVSVWPETNSKYKITGTYWQVGQWLINQSLTIINNEVA